MKKIVFLTGTRADFGKLKSLMLISQKSEKFKIYVFVTGMHLNPLYGETVDEVIKAGFNNIYQYKNHDSIGFMDRILSNTIQGFSKYVAKIKPDLIVVHGDRVEALAGAIVGSLNNILVAHIEGGEISGTIDESIRHSVSKMSHIHLVSNQEAKNRLIQLGEFKESIFVLGSPDLDLMEEKKLPSINKAKDYYGISFENYSIAMFHPITTEYDRIKEYSKNFVDALIDSDLNYILIYPNNDLGSLEIIKEFKRIKSHKKIKIFPSLRFEYFLRFLKEASFIIGNSSAGIKEAPFYNIPTIDIGTRQNNRAKLKTIFNCNYNLKDILFTIDKIKNFKNQNDEITKDDFHFGKGRSDELFLELISSENFWKIEFQKQFQEFI